MSHTISDLVVSNVVLDDATFYNILTRDAPAGFSSFQRFVPGEYEYQSALFRIQMVSTSGDRGVVNRLAVAVDVPDVFDRGDVVVDTAGIVTVKFNRAFHVPPIVVLTVQSASDACTAKLVESSVTRTSFKAYLERTSDLAKIIGAFTWAAHAY